MRRPAARLAAGVALATAALLGSGSPAMAKVPSPSPGHGSQLRNARTATCVKGPDGRLIDCPKPLSAEALPKAARDTSILSTVSDPAALQSLAQATGGSSRRIGHESDSAVSVPRIVPVRSGSQFAGNDWIGLRISDSGIVRGVQISPLFVGLLGLAILFGALVAGWLGESGRRFRRQA